MTLFRRFFVVFGLALPIILAARLVRGWTLADAMPEAALWALVSATIYAGAAYYHQIRRQRRCALCRDEAR